MKNLNINFGKMISLKGVSLVLVGGLLACTLTGCGKKAECSVSSSHAHLYTNENGYTRYIESEALEYDGLIRSEEYTVLSEKEEALYKFLNKKGLFRIDENFDLIMAQQEANKDFTIYEYTDYFYIKAIRYTSHHWTNDPNHEDLTGGEIDCHYVYQAYNVVVDEKGNYVLVPSEEVTDLSTIMEDYPFIKAEYFKAVDMYGKEVDFEHDIEEQIVKSGRVENSETPCDCGCECSHCLCKSVK